jgi:hypothetical protein
LNNFKTKVCEDWLVLWMFLLDSVLLSDSCEADCNFKHKVCKDWLALPWSYWTRCYVLTLVRWMLDTTLVSSTLLYPESCKEIVGYAFT